MEDAFNWSILEEKELESVIKKRERLLLVGVIMVAVGALLYFSGVFHDFIEGWNSVQCDTWP